MALGSNQPLTEMSTINISWEQSLPVRWADNLTTFTHRLCGNEGASTSGPVQVCAGIALTLLVKLINFNNLIFCDE
jgi:hypothetical protein